VSYCFASTNKGLEKLLIEEIKQLGATEILETTAGAQFEADELTIMKINLLSRFASRVMLQVGFGSYRDCDDIYKIAHKIKWEEWFSHKHSIKVATNAIHSPLKSLDFVTLKVKDAICDSFVDKVNFRPDVDKFNPDIKIYNFLTNDTITIYVDTSGEALFKRGYRQNKLEAPLKENLAAGLIALSNWTPEIALFDPMCGSGTILIEAISKGLNIAPGLNRSFGFEKLQMFDLTKWESLKLEAKNAINLNVALKIYANDIDRNAIQILKDNLKYLKIDGIENLIQFHNMDFLDVNAPEATGILITNPPYGIRLEEQDDLASLYPKIATHLKNNYSGWDCFFLTADLRMPKLMRLNTSRKTPIFNGPLECRLFEFKMVSGSNRIIKSNDKSV
jgi:putative N6-adenine-specific DNA methylase